MGGTKKFFIALAYDGVATPDIRDTEGIGGSDDNSSSTQDVSEYRAEMARM